MPECSNLADALRSEIECVHDFIAAWFRGETVKDRVLFDQRLRSHLASDMVNIQPSGKCLTANDLCQDIWDGHGINPAFQINITLFKLITVSDCGLVAVGTYVEHQRGAMNTTPSENKRFSTIVVQRAEPPNSFRWLHLQETGLAC